MGFESPSLVLPPSPSATPPWRQRGMPLSNHHLCDSECRDTLYCADDGAGTAGKGAPLDYLDSLFSRLSSFKKYQFLFKRIPNLITPEMSSGLSLVLRGALRANVTRDLPHEVINTITSYLDTESLISARCVSREWKSLLDAMDNVWYTHWQAFSKEFSLQNDDDRDSRPSSPLRRLLTGRALRRSWFKGTAERSDIHCHDSAVITCLQMLDENRVASASDDGTIQIWSTETAQRLMVLAGHTGGVWAIHSVDGRLLSGSTDRSLRFWCIDSGRCLGILKGHTSTVRCVSLTFLRSGEGRLPLGISGSRDTSIRVWDLRDMSCRFIFSGHSAAVRCLVVEEDRGIVVSGSYDCTARVWDLSTGLCLHILIGHHAKIYSVSIFDSVIATGSMDSNIFIWDAVSGNNLLFLEGHRGIIGSLSFIDKSRLVSSNTDGSVRIWNVSTGDCLHRLRMENNAAVTFLQANKSIIVAGADRVLRVWETCSGKFVRDLITDVDTIWRLAFDNNACVAGCQKLGRTTLIILRFSS